MESENKEFEESLDTLVHEILCRVEEVGLEQAAEEYWEKAKQDLSEISDRIEAYRRSNHIPESEM